MNSTRVLALREVVRMAMANNFPPPHLQDPNDEPASVLLDRIRAERAAAPKAKRGRRTKADT